MSLPTRAVRRASIPVGGEGVGASSDVPSWWVLAFWLVAGVVAIVITYFAMDWALLALAILYVWFVGTA